MAPSSPPLRGLTAATFTPMHADASIDLDRIAAIVEHLVANGISALYVLGSTGEGLSLTIAERKTVAESFVSAAAGRLPVIVQVGNECLWHARELAAHAQEIGATAISAMSPVYFKPDSVETLALSMAEITAGAPELPFYYYHIPRLTGVDLDMVEFLSCAESRLPTLRGIKFTSPDVESFRRCVELAAGRYDILWGLDERLLEGLQAGARGAVGSTYNFAPSIYRHVLAAFDAGDLDTAREHQARSREMVDTFLPYGGRASQKAIMAMTGLDCGPTRLPNRPLDDAQFAALREELAAIGFFDWIAESAR